jgi:3-methyladenine DNA glycosylase AlkD
VQPAALESLGLEIEAGLRAAGDPARAAQSKAYLKSDLVHLGVSVPEMRRVTLSFLRAHEALEHEDLMELALELWSSPLFDPRRVGLELLVQRSDEGRVVDLPSLEGMLRTAETWALVDEMAIQVVGSIVERDASSLPTLDRWSVDDDFWIRRSAMLALLEPIRAGAGDFERFGLYADQMLDEKEFFIRKAIGWVLREAAKKRPSLVYDWLAPRAARASGVTLREAVKHLSEEQRSSLLVLRG